MIKPGVGTIAIVFAAAVAVCGPALAQNPQARPVASRDDAVKNCVAVAQQQVAAVMGDTDNKERSRMAVYSSCMQEAGFPP